MGGIYEIGGSLYYFDWNGQMACNEIIFTEGYPEQYYATSSGALAVNTNMNINGKKYYFDSKGQLYQGVHEIDGKLYVLKMV